MHNLIQHHN